ncbi:N-acetyltransferase [Shewanella sp. OPT22]|nr:N-acetyltransferase [Shewanella sp. OPT22]
MIIETERLIIREFNEQDIDALFEMNRDPQILTYIPTEPFQSREQAEDLFNTVVLENYARYGYGRWAVYHKQDKKVIGFCGPKFIEELNEIEIGYRYFSEYWGKGIASEATNAILPLLPKYGIEEVIALILEGNVGSESVAKKSGLTLREKTMFMGHSVSVYHRAIKTMNKKAS